MPRELDFEGILFPTLLAIFIAAAAVYWLLDGLLARAGFYQWVWHASLFRVCLFVGLFSALGLLVYR
jgi:hypothetical protein